MALRNYNTREENEMQDLTQKQIDLAGFSEKGFSQEQINQIYEYAQMVGDELKVRNLIWSIAGANDQSDQKRIVQLMDDARKEMEIYPDSEVTMSALHGYGYLADDMYPLSKEAALDLHMRGLKIYCLQTDGTKSEYASREMQMWLCSRIILIELPSKSQGWECRTSEKDDSIRKKEILIMTERDYAIRSFKEITLNAAQHTEERMDLYYEKIKALMNNYQDLILENQMVLDELEQECQEKINENMAYALQYMDAYDYRMNLGKLKKEVNNIILIYGLCDMVNRAMTLVKYFTPNFGTEYYDVLYGCFCRHRKMTDMEIMLELGMSRASFYRKKKAALRYLGYYFFEIVVPQSANKRYKPSFPETEE